MFFHVLNKIVSATWEVRQHWNSWSFCWKKLGLENSCFLAVRSSEDFMLAWFFQLDIIWSQKVDNICQGMNIWPAVAICDSRIDICLNSVIKDMCRIIARKFYKVNVIWASNLLNKQKVTNMEILFINKREKPREGMLVRKFELTQWRDQ